MKEKIKKEYLRRTRTLVETKLYSRSYQKDKKKLGCTPCRILATILEVNEGKKNFNKLTTEQQN